MTRAERKEYLPHPLVDSNKKDFSNSNHVDSTGGEVNVDVVKNEKEEEEEEGDDDVKDKDDKEEEEDKEENDGVPKMTPALRCQQVDLFSRKEFLKI